MGLWNWIDGLFSRASGSDPFDHTGTNPASGLPMTGGVDIAGNAYGTSSHAFDDHGSTSSAGGASGFDHLSINPASGLPMTGGMDVAGNVYGTSSWDSASSSISNHDSWSSSWDSGSSSAGYDPSRGW